MFVFNITNPLTLVLLLVATILLVFLGQEIKKSYVTLVPLISFLLLLVWHVAQMITVSEEYRYLVTTISRCVAIDFVFVLITFFSYLWVDDIEARATNKRSIDNSLDWFWKKV